MPGREGYGPGGKFIHDRAHRIMESTSKQYGDKKGKQVAFAIATQQAHATGKSPKDFRTSEGVHTAKKKYDEPENMKKTATGARVLEKISCPQDGGLSMPGAETPMVPPPPMPEQSFAQLDDVRAALDEIGKTVPDGMSIIQADPVSAIKRLGEMIHSKGPSLMESNVAANRDAAEAAQQEAAAQELMQAQGLQQPGMPNDVPPEMGGGAPPEAAVGDDAAPGEGAAPGNVGEAPPEAAPAAGPPMGAGAAAGGGEAASEKKPEPKKEEPKKEALNPMAVGGLLGGGAGAVAGGLVDRDHPLRGALLGGAGGAALGVGGAKVLGKVAPKTLSAGKATERVAERTQNLRSPLPRTHPEPPRNVLNREPLLPKPRQMSQGEELHQNMTDMEELAQDWKHLQRGKARSGKTAGLEEFAALMLQKLAINPLALGSLIGGGAGAVAGGVADQDHRLRGALVGGLGGAALGAGAAHLGTGLANRQLAEHQSMLTGLKDRAGAKATQILGKSGMSPSPDEVSNLHAQVLKREHERAAPAMALHAKKLMAIRGGAVGAAAGGGVGAGALAGHHGQEKEARVKPKKSKKSFLDLVKDPISQESTGILGEGGVAKGKKDGSNLQEQIRRRVPGKSKTAGAADHLVAAGLGGVVGGLGADQLTKGDHEHRLRNILLGAGTGASWGALNNMFLHNPGASGKVLAGLTGGTLGAELPAAFSHSEEKKPAMPHGIKEAADSGRDNRTPFVGKTQFPTEGSKEPAKQHLNEAQKFDAGPTPSYGALNKTGIAPKHLSAVQIPQVSKVAQLKDDPLFRFLMTTEDGKESMRKLASAALETNEKSSVKEEAEKPLHNFDPFPSKQLTNSIDVENNELLKKMFVHYPHQKHAV